jgi:hypothetical protein
MPRCSHLTLHPSHLLTRLSVNQCNPWVSRVISTPCFGLDDLFDYASDGGMDSGQYKSAHHQGWSQDRPPSVISRLQTSRRLATRRVEESVRPGQLAAAHSSLGLVPNVEPLEFYGYPQGMPEQDPQACAKPFEEARYDTNQGISARNGWSMHLAA